MKHTRKDLTNSKIEITANLVAEDLRKHHRAAVAKLAKDVKVDGFRKGKVPTEVAAKHVDQTKLFDEVVNAAVNTALVELITLEQLQLLDKPEIAIKKFVPEQELEFVATIEVVPPVKLGDPKKLKVKKSTVKINEKDVDEVIDQLLTSAAKKSPVKRAAKNGDEAVIDFTGLKDGKEFDGGQAKDYPLLLGSNSFIPGFEEAIVGHKAGDKFDVPLTFPKDYHAKALAGADVVFKVELKIVNAIKLPKLDDKFAASVSPEMKTIADLRRDIERELTARAEFDSDQKFKNDLLDALVEKSDVEVPEVLVEDQQRAIEYDFKQNLAYRGMDEEQYLQSQGFADRAEWEEKELRPAAEKRVRSSLVLSELSRQQNIVATEEEVEQRQKQIVEQYSDPSMRAQFESDAAKRDIANRIITDKTLQRLAELSR